MTHIATHKPHLESTQIKELGYDQQTHTLAIRFHSKTGPGSLYHYKSVPPDVWTGLCECESMGKHFGANVKGKYEFTKINETPDKST